jgi:endoglucanase
LGRKLAGEKKYELELVDAHPMAPEFGVWKLEDFGLRVGRVHARSCDDLIGVSAALEALIRLKRDRARVNVIAAITRAEEVGFNGALALAADQGLPRNALVVSLETSKEMPPVKMGQGVILRVGDKASIFDSGATRFLAEVATGIQAAEKGYQFQRALMSGGTCEATAYQEYGYQSCAVCVALGNYHNCGPGNRIAVEFVDQRDAEGMVKLLVAAARGMKDYSQLVNRLPVRLKKLLQSARPRLARSKKPN